MRTKQSSYVVGETSEKQTLYMPGWFENMAPIAASSLVIIITKVYTGGDYQVLPS